ncbi:MAG: hypothetical protein ACOYOB_10840 [Myxococcota bacterium]
MALVSACATAEPSVATLDVVPAGDTGVEAADDTQPAQDVAPPGPTCNGSVALCGKRLDQVVFATAHNAFNNEAEGWLLPNQKYGLTRQLQDGVRGFMLDAWSYDGEDPALVGKVALCHGPCGLGAEWLRGGLGKLHEFLHADPGAVLVIVFENHVAEAELDVELQASGLADHTHTHVAGSPWATLGELVAADQRVVILTEMGPATRPWNHAYLQTAFDTPFAVKHAADFTCDVGRGQPGNDLFVLNHFLTNPVGSAKLAQQVNFDPLLLDRALQCQLERQHLPNLIAVDFYDLGDVLAVTHALNGAGR